MTEPFDSLFDDVQNAPDGFFGETFDREIDGPAIGHQLERTLKLMKDGVWRSLPEIARLTGDPESSISARLRDLRKARFGAYTVDRRRRAGGRLYEYRVVAS